MNYIKYSKEIAVKGSYDVVVAGAGPAGICAAVAAAREGAKVALVERYGIVGGCLTVGHVGPILGMVGPGTMRDEVLKLLGVPDNDMIGEVGVAHDIERAKRVLAEFADHENLTVFLQTAVTDVITEGETLTGLLISGKEGPGVLRGKVIIDATGDGDVSYLAGAMIEKGRREDGLTQPVTLEFTIDQVDEERGVVCIGDVDDVELGGERFLDFTKRCSEQGILPENLAAVRLHRTTKPGERQVNTTQMNGVDSTCMDQIYPADRELRKQISLLMDFFHQYLPGYEDCKLISSGTTLGVRESRRVMGEYKLKVQDLIDGAKFPDVMVHNAEFIVDIHNPAGSGQAEEEIQYVKPYDIPYRCFVPLKADNLLVAGRCISGSHRAHASYRVMSICMAMGQAAGIAAAYCAETGKSPRKAEVGEIQKKLMKAGVELFD